MDAFLERIVLAHQESKLYIEKNDLFEQAYTKAKTSKLPWLQFPEFLRTCQALAPEMDNHE